ncbi:MAG: hypothetical protein ACREOF_09515 [Gemmatimonadales bacterium]
MRSVLALAVALTAITSSRAAAQGAWGLGVEVGIVRFWGASGPLAGSDELSLRPYRPTHVGLRLDREIGALRLALNARYAQSALGGEFEGGATIFTDGFTLLELAPEAAVPLARFGPGAALRGFAGPVLYFWMHSDEATRTRVGARGGLELEAPLGGRVSVVTRLHGGIAGSALDQADVPPGYEVRSMPSAGVALGLRVGL